MADEGVREAEEVQGHALLQLCVSASAANYNQLVANQHGSCRSSPS